MCSERGEILGAARVPFGPPGVAVRPFFVAVRPFFVAVRPLGVVVGPFGVAARPAGVAGVPGRRGGVAADVRRGVPVGRAGAVKVAGPAVACAAGSEGAASAEGAIRVAVP